MSYFFSVFAVLLLLLTAGVTSDHTRIYYTAPTAIYLYYGDPMSFGY